MTNEDRKKAPKSKKNVIITPTEAQYIENRMAGMTAREAIIESDYNIPTNHRHKAMETARKIESKLAGNPAMIQAIEQAAVTRERVANKLSDLLDAAHVISVGEDGKVVTRPDNPTQLKALEMAVKIYDGFPVKKVDVQSFSFETSVQILADLKENPEMVAQLMKVAGVSVPDKEDIEVEGEICE